MNRIDLPVSDKYRLQLFGWTPTMIFSTFALFAAYVIYTLIREPVSHWLRTIIIFGFMYACWWIIFGIRNLMIRRNQWVYRIDPVAGITIPPDNSVLFMDWYLLGWQTPITQVRRLDWNGNPAIECICRRQLFGTRRLLLVFRPEDIGVVDSQVMSLLRSKAITADPTSPQTEVAADTEAWPPPPTGVDRHE